jgi:ATP-dependent Lhr-like helicase
MLEIGRESVPGDAGDTLLRETAEELVAEALGKEASDDVTQSPGGEHAAR